MYIIYIYIRKIFTERLKVISRIITSIGFVSKLEPVKCHWLSIIIFWSRHQIEETQKYYDIVIMRRGVPVVMTTNSQK